MIASLASKFVAASIWLTAYSTMPAAGQGRPPLDIRHSERPAERATADALRRLLAAYPLARFLCTTAVRIRTGARPASHPVLTLNTRDAVDADALLAGFVHEQLHWCLGPNTGRVLRALPDLRALYPRPATEGAPRRSTYAHLIVCRLEADALILLIGRQRALATLRRRPVYRWIYDTIIADEPRLRPILDRHGLTLDSVAARADGADQGRAWVAW